MIDCLAEPISGDGVTALPYDERFHDQLKAACAEDRDIWEIYPISFGPDDFDSSIAIFLGLPNTVTFVLFEGEVLVGMSSFLRATPATQVLEIGGTYYRPGVRGSGINRRIKDMMIRRAFDCGFTRIEFRVDSRNARSQAAMTKLGAVREGVMRKDRTTWTGHRRDTVLFSILKDEWPTAAPSASVEG